VTAEAVRRSPLAARADDLDRLEAVELAFLAQIDVRCQAEDAARLGFPTAPNTVTGDMARGAIWLGPDEWLVVAPPGTEVALETELAEALAGLGSVVGLSANRTAIQVIGPRARDVLAKGCALDLHPRAFGPQRCAQTLLGRAPVVLEQLGDDPLAFGLLVRGSFAAYVATWLLAAAEEFSSARASADRRQRSVRATSLNV
jgi:sarcosine oxidase, subunit gamma